jgi:predicted DsbA family dithiol-disulfide isomerase
MKIEIWSDVVCPWCYVGRRRLEAALARFDGASDVEVVHRAFELDPRAPTDGTVDLAEHLASKYGTTREQALGMMERIMEVGAESGIEFRFDIAARANTFDAHRLIRFASERGLGEEMVERLMRAYFSEGEPVADRTALARLAAEVGLDLDEVAGMLSSDAHVDAVRGDEATARELGVTGVPFFLIDGKVAIPGAQDVDTMLRILERARDRTLAEP